MADDATGGDALVIVARVRKAQGIRGELLLEPLTDTPDATFASGRRVFGGNAKAEPLRDSRNPTDASGRFELTIDNSRPFKGGWVVRFKEISDRTEAEKWRGRYLLSPISELAPLQSDEVYIHDLIGLDVENPGGEKVGRISATYDLPQGLTLGVNTAKGEVLVLYRAEIISHTDLSRKALVLRNDLEFLS